MHFELCCQMRLGKWGKGQKSKQSEWKEHGKLLQFVAKTKKVSLVEKEMQQSKGWEMRRGRYLNPFPTEFSLPQTKLQSATPTILAPPILMTLDNHPQKNRKIGKWRRKSSCFSLSTLLQLCRRKKGKIWTITIGVSHEGLRILAACICVVYSWWVTFIASHSDLHFQSIWMAPNWM